MEIIAGFRGFIAILSGLLLFLCQRWLFSTGAAGLIQIGTMSRQEYTNNYFTPGALVVLIVSGICAIIWYIIASRWSIHFAPIKEMKSARLIWCGLSLPPVLSVIAMGLWFGNVSPSAFPWMLLFLILNMLIVYWLATVLATPEEMIPAVMGGTRLRWR